MVHFSGGAAAAAAKLLQSCLPLCGPIDSSPPGSPVPGILQARTLERVGTGSIAVGHGLAAPQHVQSSLARDGTHVSCIARQIPSH